MARRLALGVAVLSICGFAASAAGDGRRASASTNGSTAFEPPLNLVENNGITMDWSPPVMSGNGRYVAYVSGYEPPPGEIAATYVLDLKTGLFDQVDLDNNGRPAQTNADWAPGEAALSISDDGRFVLFGAPCTFLNGTASPYGSDCSRLFVRDRQLKKTVAVPYPADEGQYVYSGSELASMSADGRFVVFEGYDNGSANGGASGSVNVYLFDVQAHSLREIYETPGGVAGGGLGFVGIDGDGTEVVVQATECDQKPCYSAFNRLYVLNTVSGTRRIVVESHNNPATGDIGFPQVYGQRLSRDGRWLAANVRPEVNSLPHLNLYDLTTGAVEHPTGADGQPIPSGVETWSSDDRYVALQTYDAPNTNSGAYVYDRVANTTDLLQQDGANPIISADGNCVLVFGTEPSLNLHCRSTPHVPATQPPDSPGGGGGGGGGTPRSANRCPVDANASGRTTARCAPKLNHDQEEKAAEAVVYGISAATICSFGAADLGFGVMIVLPAPFLVWAVPMLGILIAGECGSMVYDAAVDGLADPPDASYTNVSLPSAQPRVSAPSTRRCPPPEQRVCRTISRAIANALTATKRQEQVHTAIAVARNRLAAAAKANDIEAELMQSGALKTFDLELIQLEKTRVAAGRALVRALQRARIGLRIVSPSATARSQLASLKSVPRSVVSKLQRLGYSRSQIVAELRVLVKTPRATSLSSVLVGSPRFQRRAAEAKTMLLAEAAADVRAFARAGKLPNALGATLQKRLATAFDSCTPNDRILSVASFRNALPPSLRGSYRAFLLAETAPLLRYTPGTSEPFALSCP